MLVMRTCAGRPEQEGRLCIMLPGEDEPSSWAAACQHGLPRRAGCCWVLNYCQSHRERTHLRMDHHRWSEHREAWQCCCLAYGMTLSEVIPAASQHWWSVRPVVC